MSKVFSLSISGEFSVYFYVSDVLISFGYNSINGLLYNNVLSVLLILFLEIFLLLLLFGIDIFGVVFSLVSFVFLNTTLIYGQLISIKLFIGSTSLKILFFTDSYKQLINLQY